MSTLKLTELRDGTLGLGVNPHKNSWGDNLDELVVTDSSGNIRPIHHSIIGNLGYWDGAFHEVKEGSYLLMTNDEYKLEAVKVIKINKDDKIAEVEIFSTIPAFLGMAAATFWKKTKGDFNS